MNDIPESKLLGAMASHVESLATRAEGLQMQAEAMLGQVDGRMLTLQKTAANLFLGIDEQAQALKVQEQRFAAQIDAFAEQVAQLGPQAFAGGKSAVAPEIRAALQGAASVVGKAAQAVTAPTQKAMDASLAALDRAQAALTQAQAWFAWRSLAMIGAATLGGLVLAGLGGSALIGWERLEISNAKQEVSKLQAREQALSVAIADMEQKGRDLDAKGVRFQTAQCLDNDKRKRLCVEIEPGTSSFYLDGGRQQFFVPKGF
jgi:hypothetical protein